MFFFAGCGPRLDRPGYHPPPDSSTRAPIEIFRDAENDFIKQMNFHFTYYNFNVLSGVKGEVMQVISKYPPNSIGAGTVLSMTISNLIETVFTEKMASLGFQPRDMECVRDYSRLCPSRWVDLGDGVTCESPFYMFQDEACKQVKFGGLNPVEKSEAAWNCAQSKFPCRHACNMDFSRTCPEGWKPLTGAVSSTGSICIAPPEYKQPCVKVYDFAGHNFKLKRKFADMCKVTWPCRAKQVPISSHLK